MNGFPGVASVNRRSVLVTEVLKMLEMRVFGPQVSAQEVAQRSRQASLLGLGAVICRPEHIRTAAHAVAGTGVEVCTAVDFHTPRAPLPDPRALALKSLRLAEAGATSLALIATRQRLEVDGGRPFARALAAVTAAAHSCGATSRALVDTGPRDRSHAHAAARLCADAGVSLIQAGAWEGPRANFDHIREFRATIGPDIRLKWTTPVRSIDVLLLGMAEGANRFNGDVQGLIHQIETQALGRPMVIPHRGWDY